jgi:hypothetical protein
VVQIWSRINSSFPRNKTLVIHRVVPEKRSNSNQNTMAKKGGSFFTLVWSKRLVKTAGIRGWNGPCGPRLFRPEVNEVPGLLENSYLMDF